MAAKRARRSWREALRHAFSVPAEEPLTDREQQWLDRLAREAVRRRLTVPALVLLRSVQPLNFVGSQAVVFFKPIISFIFPPQRVDEVARLLEKRTAPEALVEKIEHYEARGTGASGNGDQQQ
jgi:hypothetical protein